jgi:hypothetical protein
MGCAAATAKRRRKQAVMGYTQWALRGRPIYRSHSKETYDRRAAAANERRREMAARSVRKKG